MALRNITVSFVVDMDEDEADTFAFSHLWVDPKRVQSGQIKKDSLMVERIDEAEYDGDSYLIIEKD